MSTPIKQPPHTAGVRFQGLRSAIDPAQIPSVADAALDDQAVWSGEIFHTCDTQRAIPLSTSEYNAVDQGNSSPKFFRATTYAIPYSADLANSCGIPLALFVQPFAQSRRDEGTIPLIDPGPDGPLRCGECRAYVNPWTVWTAGGQRWVCNMCGHESQVRPTYYSPLNEKGHRTDLSNRPELRHGTVEFIVGSEYWSNSPAPRLLPSFMEGADQDAPTVQGRKRAPSSICTLFAIDVSEYAVKSGMVQEVCAVLLELLFGIESTEKQSTPLDLGGRQVGIMTYNSGIHFWNISPDLTNPEMLVVADIDEVFVPMRQGFFAHPHSSKHLIEEVLKIIPRIFARDLQIHNATFPALQAALAAMIHVGGEVIVFNGNPPNHGRHLLPLSDETVAINDGNESHLFVSQDLAWRELGEELAEAGVGVHLFAFPSQSSALATLASVSASSGGDVFLHHRYHPKEHRVVLSSQLASLLTREVGFDVRMRTRLSPGLQASSYLGNVSQAVNGDVVLGVCSAASTICVKVEHSRSLDKRKDVYAQSAVLYTSADGQRRVRIMNLALAGANMAHNVFRFADVDATTSFFVREALFETTFKSSRKIREALTLKISQLLLSYRRQCAASTALTQLILPEAFKLLPVYTLGLFKTAPLRGGSTSADARNWIAHMMRSRSVGLTIHQLYPRLFALHVLAEHAAMSDTRTGWIALPPYLRASYTSMRAEGIYLIDNGLVSILWLGRLASPKHLWDLFGVTQLSEVARDASPLTDSLLSQQLHNVLRVLWARRGLSSGPLLIARQDMDPTEIDFSDMLIEDQNNGAMSYTDYVCTVHKEINQALSSTSNYSFWDGW